MRYVIDHDLHNHSMISPCSNDPHQTKEAILAYALTNQFKVVGLSDHFWDQWVDHLDAPGWIEVGNGKWQSALPLPQSKHCRFLMGAEVDMNRHGIIGISAETLGKVDYCILSPSHLHLKGFVTDPSQYPLQPNFVKEYYLKRLDILLSRSDLPFHKLGLAHFHVCLIEKARLKETLDLFSDRVLEELFGRIAAVGMGVELNFSPGGYDADTLEAVLRPYRIAKAQGCKFYLGGDSHHPESFANCRRKFEQVVDLLALTEDDKWEFVKKNTEEYND